MFLILFTILIGLLVIHHLYKYQTHWRHIRKFPGPISFPIIGNAHNFGRDPIANHVNMFDMWKTYGKDIFRAWVGYRCFIILTNPKDVEVVLSSNTLLKKSDVYELLDDWLGEGLLTSSGQKWFKHRKMITPSFHFKILQEFHDVMKKNSKKFIQKLYEKSKSEKMFDVQDMIHYCTLDVICETAMGTEINAMDNNDSELVKAFQDMCFVVQRRAFDPFKGNSFLYKFTKEYQIEKKALNVLKTFTMDVIEKRRNYIDNSIANNNMKINNNNDYMGNKNNNNDDDDGGVDKTSNGYFGKVKQAFLDTLLMSKIDDRPLTTQEIYEEVSTFMFEGHDTTTSGITFAIHLLSRHPDVQTKVYEEQLSIFGSENLNNMNPSYQDVQEMKYLDLVIKESLRLYPSVPLIGRHTTEGIHLNGKFIPADTTLTIYIMAMGYNEKYFPDPYKFNPERFNDRNVVNPFDYVPFSAGPRNCIGQKFAMLEMKSILSHIVRCFEILPATDELLNNGGYEYIGSNKKDPIFASLLTLKSDNGVYIRLRPRNN